MACYLNKHKYNVARDAFDLFDTLVKPIVIFDSEIRAINISKEVRQFFLIIIIIIIVKSNIQ